jgi:hypothetical protein
MVDTAVAPLVGVPVADTRLSNRLEEAPIERSDVYELPFP